MPRTFSGTTEDSQLPILGAQFWTKGKVLEGQFLRKFLPPQSRIGALSVMQLRNPLKLKNENKGGANTPWELDPKNQWMEDPDGESYQTVQIGALSGFDMAVRACNCGELQPGDLVRIECTGTKKTVHSSDQILFKVSVSRA